MKDNPVLNILALPAAIAFSYYLTFPLCDLFGYENVEWLYIPSFFVSLILMLYVFFPNRNLLYSANIFIAIFIAAGITFFFTTTFCNWFDYKINPLAYVFTFIGSVIFIKLFIYPIFGIWIWRRNKKAATLHSERKFSENVSLRRIKGFFINIFIIPPIIYFLWKLGFYFLNLINPGFLPRFTDFEQSFYDVIVMLLFSFLTAYAVFYLFYDGCQVAKEWFGRIVINTWPRRYKFGRGGSASFGGIFEDWASRHKKGYVLIGASLYERFCSFFLPKPDGYFVGQYVEQGIITIANSRGGKGRSAIIPNLIQWPHSALVIDPKGKNAAVTAARRGTGGGRVKRSLGQDVHIVDPFNEVTQNSACFNPLDAINLNSIELKEDIGMIADALISTEDGQIHGSHFTDNAKKIVSGVIAHLLTTTTNATLLDVQRSLTLPSKDQNKFYNDMMANQRAARMPITAATTLRDVGDNERGSFFSTIKTNTDWIDSLAMKPILGSSSFKLSDIKNGNTTVYIVLPPRHLHFHQRFMRMFVNLSLMEMCREPKAKNQVLFVMDEFFSLGALSELEKAAGLLSEYKVKLWPILQDISQIKKLYPHSWPTFFANAGIKQFFSISDPETQNYLKDVLSQTAYGKVIINLREASELDEELARDSGRQIVIRSGKMPLLLRRTNYDAMFPKSMYSPDPDHPKS